MTRILAPLSAQVVAHDVTYVLGVCEREDFFVARGDEERVSRVYEVCGDATHELFVEVKEGASCVMSCVYRVHEKEAKARVRVSILLQRHAQISLDIASFCEGVAQESDVRVFVVFNALSKATVRTFTRASGSRGVVHEEIRGLMLGDAASASFIPELSLLHDDIVATHATSVTKIDEKHVAYLLSRGVVREDAVKCFTDAFLWRSI